MKRITTLLAATAAATALATSPATAQELPKSPAKACAQLALTDPGLYGFIATKPGGCQSSLATVGYDALTQGAFPSNAAAVGNCKTLEGADFLAGKPAGAKPYPYTFYESLVAALPFIPGTDPAAVAAATAYFTANRELFTARNRAGCVDVLRRIHGGLAGPIFAALPQG
jgi:hypothetical protein